MLFLAMSCLQARPQLDALLDLLRLAPDGLQLTPGNQPTPGFRALVARAGLAVRTHHGFAWDAYRREPYAPDGRALHPAETEHSVHPPAPDAGIDREAWLSHALARGTIVETMYPGEWLGSGTELRWAMDRGARLAVDVSHLHIQRAQGALDDATLARVLDYEHVAEVHVSANDGRRDQHRALDADSFGLAWARERLRAGTPVVLECYLHRLAQSERRRQLDLLRD